MGCFWVVAKHYEGRRANGDLFRENDFQTAMVKFRRWIHVLGITNDVVQDRSWNSTMESLVTMID